MSPFRQDSGSTFPGLTDMLDVWSCLSEDVWEEWLGGIVRRLVTVATSHHSPGRDLKRVEKGNLLISFRKILVYLCISIEAVLYVFVSGLARRIDSTGCKVLVVHFFFGV